MRMLVFWKKAARSQLFDLLLRFPVRRRASALWTPKLHRLHLTFPGLFVGWAPHRAFALSRQGTRGPVVAGIIKTAEYSERQRTEVEDTRRVYVSHHVLEDPPFALGVVLNFPLSVSFLTQKQGEICIDSVR